MSMANTVPDRMDPVLKLLEERPRQDWEWRFEPDAIGHSATNALALGNVALLAYSDEADVRHFLEKWGLVDARILRGFDTQGFVTRQKDAVFVSFRGTEPINIDDWLSDVNFHQRKLHASVPGLVHGGFALALEEVVQPMLDAVMELSSGDRTRLFITGHSMGGALAVLAAALLRFGAGRNVTAVYTYGQPRVGDPEFSSAFDGILGSVTFRYVNDFDIVPHVPPAQLPGRPLLRMPDSATDFLRTLENAPRHVLEALKPVVAGEHFAHVGQLKLFLADNVLTDDKLLWQEREVIYSGTFADLLRNAPGLLRAQLASALSIGHRLTDHDPLNGYVPKLAAQLR
jgi:triacylglycerol lipase